MGTKVPQRTERSEMPRIREDAPVDEVPAPEATDETPKPKRTRRPAPEGVTLGLLDAPKPVDAPPTAARGGRRGRSVDPKTVATIELLKANPGQWYELGVFRSAQAPTKDSALGKEGFEFKHSPNGDGTFTRYASMPVTSGSDPASAA